MKIDVVRQPSDDTCTLGEMLIEGFHECFTLEPPVREVPGQPVCVWKIPGRTAVPAGTYAVAVRFSPHFGCEMPHVEGIEGFSEVMIHPGNVAANTEGCCLVGETLGVDQIIQSRAAFELLFEKIKAALAAGDDIAITYQ